MKKQSVYSIILLFSKNMKKKFRSKKQSVSTLYEVIFKLIFFNIPGLTF
jgi:hypothetical protein